MPELDSPVPTDVTAPSAADAPVVTEAPTAPVEAPTDSEVVTNSGDADTEQNIPFSRFQEVNNKAKAESERATELQARLDEIEAQTTKEPDVDIDPEVKETLDAYMKQQGYVRQEDLQAKELALQADRDMAALKTQYSGFDKQKVLDFAKEKSISLTSKDAVEATYLFMNKDSILEAERKSAVAAAESAPKSVAERPGAGGASQASSQAEVTGGLKERIAAALSNAR